MKNTVIVHYHTPSGNYFKHNIWQWQDGQAGQEASFSRYDSFGAVACLAYDAPYFLNQVYVIVKEQFWQSQTGDYAIQRTEGLPKTEVWLVDGDARVYYSRQAAVASKHYKRRKRDAYDMATNSQAFDKKWGFDGWLGFRYSPFETSFRLWAPTAERVQLILYHSTAAHASVSAVLEMGRGSVSDPNDHRKNTHGVWFLKLEGDYNYQAYCYRIYYRKRTFADSRDPYTIATTANGQRSVVVAQAELVPKGFQVRHGQAASWRLENPNQAVIYEMHVRDFSQSVSSGVSAKHRGKFKGLIETGTKNRFGDSTCFDYVKTLGITHIQLQQVFDHHHTFDHSGQYNYNWGYDPENYNVPDASFTTNPDQPATRIKELKEVIQAYHNAGLNVVMDVVYNHTFSNKDSAFQLTVPDYYYRMNPDGSFQNGSGCGNETASEKEMFRKYMIDSVLYWLQEYNIDGFRFDLMGLHDVETMQRIRAAVDAVDPRILIYGEGWDMGNGLPSQQKAIKRNADQLPGIGFFNDDERNAIKGAEVYGSLEKGFVSGLASEGLLAKALLGSDEIGTYQSPSQVINYVEAHDNYNLNDLLWALHPKDSDDTHRQRVQVATAINLLMQGIAFMQIGQEFLRTKLYPTGLGQKLTQEDQERAMNSYNASDDVNQINWDYVSREQPTIAFVKKLLALKTKSPYFSYPTFSEIRQHVYIESAKPNSGFISFTVEDKQKLKIIFTNNRKRLLKETNYAIIESNDKRFQFSDSLINELSVVILDIPK
ncbi:type I pullulanase [Streptococcus halichoeri]|uniref:type I pullulanase n=1 Tax=Streptococcus halichoeri TaxID=254785 RepID=UPI00135CA59B|nr:type I pullulanase [Streptococcus halichoeri]